jgi:hypothetical protein
MGTTDRRLPLWASAALRAATEGRGAVVREPTGVGTLDRVDDRGREACRQYSVNPAVIHRQREADGWPRYPGPIRHHGSFCDPADGQDGTFPRVDDGVKAVQTYRWRTAHGQM